jgi:uncharacterized protein YyaL (SSP411 family)
LMDPRVYATVVRGVLDYMRRDMTHPDGGLYSAEVGLVEVVACLMMTQLCGVAIAFQMLVR